MTWLAARWDAFWYNFAWPDYVGLLNGPLAKLALFFPVIGYAILFNDFIAQKYAFSELTGDLKATYFLPENTRLRLVFFGLMLLASANLLYRWRRPYCLRLGESLSEYTDCMMRFATAGTFLEMHRQIRGAGFDPWTVDGKYYDDDWDLFWREAVWTESGQNVLQSKNHSQELPGYERVDFTAAKQRHQTLLLSIIRETYFRESRKRRGWLISALILASSGYALMLLPSVDLTLRVLEFTIIGL
jgi:hypothetical protein